MKINLILLASGNSKRFNGNKLLTKFNNKPLYIYTLDKIKSIKGLSKVIVVTQYEEIKSRSIDLGFDVVLNQESNLGISNSIILGINKDTSADGYM
ncbi:NTP transferase domain-containing protein, partial [Clostridium saudiense]|nr:NTP transferase domain-containing protein [Clostridium saudiense]